MTPQQFDTWLKNSARPPLLMGVLNVTPDSFSDGGRFLEVSAALDHALRMVAEGAELIDVGGESTRPGSSPTLEAEQIRRVVPVIRAVRKASPVTLSIDTTLAAVARAALDAGANLINDTSAGRGDLALLPLAADRRCPVILMHALGSPATMQNNPIYRDVTAEVVEFLVQRIAFAQSRGVDAADLLIDPGIGFGKTAEHNVRLLANLPRLAAIGRPVVVGVSRKSFIGKITGENEPRLFGTAAAVAWSAMQKVAILRVHDIGPMSAVLRMIQAVAAPDGSPLDVGLGRPSRL